MLQRTNSESITVNIRHVGGLFRLGSFSSAKSLQLKLIYQHLKNIII